ncbi:MAG: mandelate racemase/muconate lactonizing enzyme family protein [Solirubrobacteraceae bacterium]
MRLDVRSVTRRFAAPVTTAHGVLHERELIEVEIEDGDGVVGRGEAAPLGSYDGVTVARVQAALEAYRPLEPAGTLEACRARDPLPQALAAIDIALLDIAAQRTGLPLSAMLGTTAAAVVEVNASIGALEPEAAADAAARAAASGYRTIKLKVGTGDDLARIAAVRDAVGGAVALRLDANGAWSVVEAARILDAAGPIELVEEPVRGLVAMAELRSRVAVRIALDESADEPGALASGAAGAVCLKLSRCGGIGGVLDAATRARAAGVEPYLASTYDGPRGIAAAVHAAAALAPVPACGLATLELFDAAAPPELAVRDGRITVPPGPGLGVA